MTDLTATVDTYLSAFGEPDRGRRAGLIDAAWAVDGRLLDPPLTGEGHDAISDMADVLQQHFAGHRFAWELVAPDGTVALTGLDVGEVAEDGRLRRITGFFGELEARPGIERAAPA